MKYRKLHPYKYELMEDETIRVDGLDGINIKDVYFEVADNIIIAKKYYCWDGASGIPNNPDNMKASLFHDVLYQSIREGFLDKKYKDAADRILQRLCIEAGMSKFWAGIIYTGVKMFGSGALKKKPEVNEQIIEIE